MGLSLMKLNLANWHDIIKYVLIYISGIKHVKLSVFLTTCMQSKIAQNTVYNLCITVTCSVFAVLVSYSRYCTLLRCFSNFSVCHVSCLWLCLYRGLHTLQWWELQREHVHYRKWLHLPTLGLPEASQPWLQPQRVRLQNSTSIYQLITSVISSYLIRVS